MGTDLSSFANRLATESHSIVPGLDRETRPAEFIGNDVPDHAPSNWEADWIDLGGEG
jgi:hypothetical protein